MSLQSNSALCQRVVLSNEDEVVYNRPQKEIFHSLPDNQPHPLTVLFSINLFSHFKLNTAFVESCLQAFPEPSYIDRFRIQIDDYYPHRVLVNEIRDAVKLIFKKFPNSFLSVSMCGDAGGIEEMKAIANLPNLQEINPSPQTKQFLDLLPSTLKAIQLYDLNTSELKIYAKQFPSLIFLGGGIRSSEGIIVRKPHQCYSKQQLKDAGFNLSITTSWLWNDRLEKQAKEKQD